MVPQVKYLKFHIHMDERRTSETPLVVKHTHSKWLASIISLKTVPLIISWEWAYYFVLSFVNSEEWHECAIRETLEETGLKIKNVSFATAINAVVVEENYHYITIFMKGEIDMSHAQEPENLEPHKCKSKFRLRFRFMTLNQQYRAWLQVKFCLKRQRLPLKWFLCTTELDQ